MISRTHESWELRQLDDRPSDRHGAGPLIRVLFEREGKPAGYALYRHRTDFVEGRSNSTLEIREAIGADIAATAAVWRYLFDIDLMAQIHVEYMPIDHPLFFLLAEPRRLRLRAQDGIWLRLVDVESALRARSFASSEQLVLEVADSFCPERGLLPDRGGRDLARRRRGRPAPRRARAGERLHGRLQLRSAGRCGLVEELRPGGIACADRLFISSPAPWCPEMF